MKPMKYILLAVLGMIIIGFFGIQYMERVNPGGHPIGFANTDTEVHLHSDFIVFLDGEKYDFTDDKYQSLPGHEPKHKHIHLHDNEDDVIHRHDHGITLADFFDSLGFTLTDECITTDTEKMFCSDDTNQLMLFINGASTSTIASYVNQEEDRLLMYYGDPQSESLAELIEQVTDKSCIYSGTCPERGVAPPESCGLTCEI